MHEPSLFFLGASEIQSIPLTAIDFFTHVPPVAFAGAGAEAAASAVFEAAKYTFAALFFYARIWLWLQHTAAFVANARAALRTGAAKKGGKWRASPFASTITVFMVSLLFMTALQLYWGGLILVEASKLLI